ncbi:GTP 3',8-cyclase MoaA [Ferrimonas lipolytica]|uniref:GTP 3',8-cyclase n=1 Tax=Ferrimonas lipolytica TaxID=2724191 RepID=A0A6H1UGR9_9GAMM|nr:GTP 3',8-cyclase MoaA [Ferrimonas lipolytica]QIZ78018.1 GTP 3',8-cyclase MoaA [Ferrimonas lipolytica]
MSLTDGFGRKIDYLRLSVTDRCDFRCIYCMDEDPTFLPRSQVLTLEEIQQIAQAFTELGVRKIRLTGGEPLVKSDLVSLVSKLSALPGLDDLCMTTNGSRLTKFAKPLADAGLMRLNISLDTLDEERFKATTRNGQLNRVLAGIDAAREAGYKQIKLNAVAIKGNNDDEIVDLVNYARSKQIDITFIEEMPLGVLSDNRREHSLLTSDEVKAKIEPAHSLISTTERSGGPARYYRMADSNTRVGFISPHSNNFCQECNRVRVTTTGELLLCLGNENSVDLRQAVRNKPNDIEHLKRVICEAMGNKPEKHHFSTGAETQILRFMSHTGG